MGSNGAACPDELRHLERSHSARLVRKGIGDPRESARCGVELPATSVGRPGQMSSAGRDPRTASRLPEGESRCAT